MCVRKRERETDSERGGLSDRKMQILRQVERSEMVDHKVMIVENHACVRINFECVCVFCVY